jgi:phosphoribosylglycinamide formyltransferase-1
MTPAPPVRIGVLCSGRGSNFRSLCEAQRAGQLAGGTIVLLIVNKPGVGALAVAKEFGIESVVLDHTSFPTREAHDLAIADALQAKGVTLVCHAGYMRIVGKAYLARFPNAVLNIHPALLPSFPGLNAQRQALVHGVKVSGVTVHIVEEGMDTGPIVVQAAVPVEESDTEETLSARMLTVEHRVYPEAVRLFCAGRIKIEGRRVRILPGPKS